MTTSSLNPFFIKALESISSKILIADKDLKVIYLNKSAEDFLNTTLEESENQETSKIFTEKPKNDLGMVLDKKTPKKHPQEPQKPPKIQVLS